MIGLELPLVLQLKMAQKGRRGRPYIYFTLFPVVDSFVVDSLVETNICCTLGHYRDARKELSCTKIAHLSTDVEFIKYF